MKRKFFFCSIIVFLSIYLYCQEYSTITNIPYTIDENSVFHKLDLYIPEGKGPMPCLIWIHGGAWRYGSKNGLAGEIDTLLSHGYVIASIDYRLTDTARFPAQIHDCKTAIRFLKENAARFKIDSNRIAVAGASAGGHLAALAGTSSYVDTLEDKSQGYSIASSRVHAVIDFYGPTDFLIMDNLPDTCTDPLIHLAPDSPESLLLGCNVADCPERVRFANPVTYVTNDDPPFLIFHGTLDCTVTSESSILLERELKRKGVPAELILLPGAGHGGPQFITPEVKSKVLGFLNGILY